VGDVDIAESLPLLYPLLRVPGRVMVPVESLRAVVDFDHAV
jgi:hypothetical protein